MSSLSFRLLDFSNIELFGDNITFLNIPFFLYLLRKNLKYNNDHSATKTAMIRYY